jgi:hypothetical protein
MLGLSVNGPDPENRRSSSRGISAAYQVRDRPTVFECCAMRATVA